MTAGGEADRALGAAALALDAAVADLGALRQLLGDAFLGDRVQGGEPTAVLDRSAIVRALTWLRDERGYQLLRSVTAVDYLPSEPRFHVVYHLTAIPESALPDPAQRAADGGAGHSGPRFSAARLVRLKVPLRSDDLVVESAVSVFPTANFHEREVYDMFGIDFVGHPDLRRILLPEMFQGHPLRKDHPLRYEEVAFSHNRARVHDRKPRATQ